MCSKLKTCKLSNQINLYIAVDLLQPIKLWSTFILFKITNQGIEQSIKSEMSGDLEDALLALGKNLVVFSRFSCCLSETFKVVIPFLLNLKWHRLVWNLKFTGVNIWMNVLADLRKCLNVLSKDQRYVCAAMISIHCLYPCSLGSAVKGTRTYTRSLYYLNRSLALRQEVSYYTLTCVFH